MVNIIFLSDFFLQLTDHC